MGETLAQIKTLAAAGDVLLSQHAYDRLAENGISAGDIEASIAGAVEIEDYPEFHKGPSVLERAADPRALGRTQRHDPTRHRGDGLSS